MKYKVKIPISSDGSSREVEAYLSGIDFDFIGVLENLLDGIYFSKVPSKS